VEARAMSEVQPVLSFRRRRSTELILILFACTIGAAGYLIVNLAVRGGLPAGWPIPIAIWFGIGIGLNILTRWRLPYADPVLMPCVLLLNGLGLTMIYRIDQANNPPLTGSTTQLTWTLLGFAGVVAMTFVLRDYRILHRRTYILGLAGLVLLLLPLVPYLGYDTNGARIWIRVAGFSLQPAEFAKIALAVAFAGYLVDKREVLALAGPRILGLDLPRARDLAPIALMWVASLLVLVTETDLGTSLLFFGLFVMMLYVATERPAWAILGLVLFLGGAIGAFTLAADGPAWFRDKLGYLTVRVSAWLDPFSNYDSNYQVIQAQYGMAWGGLLGRGLGEGRPWLTTFARSDFIASSIGEELGLAGLFAVIVLYGLIVARGLRMALTSRDQFGKLLATGLSFTFALQVFAIIGGVTRLLPLTGLTTPFLSQGGSSLVANWLVIGLLLIISHQARRPVPVVATRSSATGADEATTVITTGSRAASSARNLP